jgi:HD-GYP domain-containing protein (c-di-GMP phosphodiesterase class II)
MKEAPTEFIPVRIGTLRPWQAVNFDIFIKIGERHVHYIQKEDPFDGDRIAALKAKGVKKLYVPKDAEGLYLAYLDAGLGQLKDAKLTLNDRADIARDSITTAAEGAAEKVQTQAGYLATEGQVGKILDFLVSEQGAMRQMLSNVGFATDVSQHSANVVTLSVKLASSLGLIGADLLNIGVAALIHDIGKEGLGLDPTIPRESLTPEQKIIYQKHPEAASNKLIDKPYINKAILDLVLNHEEIGEGAGFPNKKRLSTLPKTQQILNLCNEYDRMCTVNKISPMDAIKQFYIDKLGLFDMELLKALTGIIQK